MSPKQEIPKPHEVYSRFIKSFRENFDPISINPEDAKDYDSELQLLRPHMNAVFWGMGTSLTLFCTFRLSRHTGPLFRMNKGYSFERMPQRTKGSSTGPTRESVKESLVSIPVDLLLSFLVGCSTTLFLTNDTKLFSDCSKLPLVKGRSKFSEDCCSDFIKKYHEVPTEFWTSKVKGDDTKRVIDEYRPLRAIQQMALNCERRKAFEDRIRKERGLSSCEPVILPDPVPAILKNIPKN